MVWREWFDDANSNQWPDEGEYQPMSLFTPNDLNPLIGQYTFMMDDTGGSLGQKVSVYLTGTDDAGHPLEYGGSDVVDKHLFMYQLAIDGAPSVARNAYSYADGMNPWLHPQMPYTFDVDITDPVLAFGHGSDPALMTSMIMRLIQFETLPSVVSSGYNELWFRFGSNYQLYIEPHQVDIEVVAVQFYIGKLK